MKEIETSRTIERYSGVYENQTIIRSNALITAKYNSTLLENNITLLAIKKAQFQHDDYGRPVVTMSVNEIREISGRNDTSLYDSLKQAAKDMGGRYLLIEDEEKHSFNYISIINKAEYADGKFTITFTPEVLDYIDNLRKNFTKMELSILWGFSSRYAQKIYEILRIHSYKIPPDNNEYAVRIPLASLRLTVGCINPSDEHVKRIMSGDNPNFDKIESVAKDKKLMSFSDFKVKALIPAVRQINAISDIYCRFECERTGRGGRVKAVIFFIRHNTQDILEESSEPPGADPAVTMFLHECGFQFNAKQIESFLKITDGNLDYVRRAYQSLLQQQDTVERPSGFMISVLKGMVKGCTVLSKQENMTDDVPNPDNVSGTQMHASDNIEEIKLKIASDRMVRAKRKAEFSVFLDSLAYTLEEFEICHPDPVMQNDMYTQWLINRQGAR